jgi:hypothetical protein
MNLLYHMIGVALWVILSDVVKSHHGSMLATGERFTSQVEAEAVFATILMSE